MFLATFLQWLPFVAAEPPKPTPVQRPIPSPSHRTTMMTTMNNRVCHVCPMCPKRSTRNTGGKFLFSCDLSAKSQACRHWQITKHPGMKLFTYRARGQNSITKTLDETCLKFMDLSEGIWFRHWICVICQGQPLGTCCPGVYIHQFRSAHSLSVQ